ncbi:hypothetical protein DFA_00441 [Cavenderia fasciculata]|uniref:IPT/TIG domain-containing protein n=1 Tax=Cavenderia fasciculata TaxID=261658 RepID=F4PRT1_CACFS|nr:uncharacterized protein DFA_00441 [Cavenderia fasciculata]EGG20580.1 hypothetical protein DFA_00441 [Cavenderia fasciculata]|eukprot:XP_004358430.1 hypothetical protein DFA_00441 [Cavenderia fasciculata]
MSNLIVLVAVLMLLLFYITPVHCQYGSFTKVWNTSKGGNPVKGHSYTFFPLTPIITDAVNNCLVYRNGLGDGTFKSYLATVDSKQELDFIKLSWDPPTWVSGSDIRGNGHYSYSTGPQTNQPLFNMYTGQCFGYCPFNAGDPSLTPVGEKYIYMRGNNLQNAGVRYDALVMCEIQPISEVYIPSIGTNGGSITINNLTQFYIQTINITFSNQSKQLSKSCHITLKQGTSVTCIVPLSGFHNVTVQDASGVNSTHYLWKPYPPFIKAVYQSFTTNGLH